MNRRPDGERPGRLFAPLDRRTPFIEPFNGRLRHERLNMHLGWSLTHAKVTIGDWKEEYNHDRPHSSLGYRTPRAYAAICTTIRLSRVWCRMPTSQSRRGCGRRAWSSMMRRGS